MGDQDVQEMTRNETHEQQLTWSNALLVGAYLLHHVNEK